MLLREALEQVRQSHPLPVAFHTSASTAEAFEWLHAGNRAVAAEPSEYRQAQQYALARTGRWMSEQMREVRTLREQYGSLLGA